MQKWPEGVGAGKALHEFVADVARAQIGKYDVLTLPVTGLPGAFFSVMAGIRAASA